MKIKISVLCTAMIVLFACHKDNVVLSDNGSGYFPTEVGDYIIYDVTQITHDTLGIIIHDTIKYQIKELIESAIIDNEGREARRIERYRRDSTTGSWTISDIWVSTLLTNRAERVEENVKYVKLIFPPKVGHSWDGNAFNTYKSWDYSYTSKDEYGFFNGNAFDSTLTVLQRDNLNLVEYEKATEVYAKNVGLIYKYYKNLIINNFDTLQITSGNELIETIVSYGKQ